MICLYAYFEVYWCWISSRKFRYISTLTSRFWFRINRRRFARHSLTAPPPPGSFLVLTLNENFDVSNVKYRIRTSIRFFFRLSVSYVVPGIDFFVPLLVFQQDRLCCAQVSLPFQPFAGRHLAWSDGSDGDEHHNMPPIGRAEILSDTLCTRDKFVFFSFLRKVPAHFPLLPRRSMHTCLIRSECSRFLFRLFGGSSV